MPQVLLLCETEPTDPSGELQCIQAVLESLTGEPIMVEGCGGDTGVRAVAAYRRQKDADFLVASVIDRDYRPLAWAEQSYFDGKLAFIWRRHEIENYWLEPAVVALALTVVSKSLPSTASKHLPLTEEAVRPALIECAQQRATVEAGRMTFWDVKRDADNVARVQWQEPQFDETGEECCVAAVITACAEVAKRASVLSSCPLLEEATVQERYGNWLAKVQSAKYLNDLAFLWDFDGKALIRCFTERTAGRPELKKLRTKGLLARELAKAFPLVHASTSGLLSPDDFTGIVAGMGLTLATPTPADTSWKAIP